MKTKHKILKRSDLFKKGKPLVIAGPCAIETKEQVTHLAREISKMGVRIFRGQLWKPRTDRESFQGIGPDGIEWLREIKKETGLIIATEIVDKDHIALTKGVVDVLWVGARNMQNYELLKAISEDPRPVILKRGLIATVDEWMKAAKYIGLDKVILCERGIRTGADAMRFTLDINGALVAKHDREMPVIIDPSHTAGRSDMVPFLAYAGMGAGMDGIVVEVHHKPHEALCDASQQILPETLKEVIKNIKIMYRMHHKSERKVVKKKEAKNIPLIRPRIVSA